MRKIIESCVFSSKFDLFIWKLGNSLGGFLAIYDTNPRDNLVLLNKLAKTRFRKNGKKNKARQNLKKIWPRSRLMKKNKRTFRGRNNFGSCHEIEITWKINEDNCVCIFRRKKVIKKRWKQHQVHPVYPVHPVLDSRLLKKYGTRFSWIFGMLYLNE